ncbi:MAG: methylenetetrahydrofolate--tRNA-(uracil(54)-C(5))-methyltransferase (FADH(2)-oxidizing) TrmFO [Candidatus Eremiobacteraeota bacterium]|nr:methylenetetrahydrofolate--tRNA-(uracil(54)-C(5))-methyltransferase (FADH(2)-oxidizing) TrmFO [Candidatus Eremiobacteraeota bacterium]MBV8283231.1 methylenetetrahydrofolate--tRNA-(uracil(54)-C(5))-methyltransferase (FADH(2)-oxidizing) TrmFO [Candidatus Eremiobacteraeota bacterium]MBV8332851.1 methylenetetrahydrofolate--tRNA-(uracil(54)-C(5))-methyltransferase (FADH(2)-oxidizing) TrmFO [Candidatus Eremiobacteraeota bacterium]MBV8722696.1 methylenetetrahydrofolate--tRNA-(uracil(54)-C(5))-methyl
MHRLTVIGGGLAGCEAAWQAAKLGVDVDLYEMRPGKSGPAHKTGALAELVCSNSLRGAALENAVGLLKEELARLDSIVVRSAREAAVPAGGALAVDRERFARLVESRIAGETRIRLHREEVRAIPNEGTAVVACGPLPSDELLASIDGITGDGRLHYYDAASPIVAADSIDEPAMYRKSRYDKGDGDDYLNIPLDRDQYLELVNDLRTLERHQPKGFELDGGGKYFEGCLPIEEMADRGDDVLRFGPLKPVGLRDPRTGKTPYAVVQLRKENVEATAYNLVGFQTRLAWPAQRTAFGKLPGLRDAEWLRLGVMHRNTFLDSPRLLDDRLRLRSNEAVYFAGQITGAEGYVEAAATGAMAGIHAARAMLGLPVARFPRESAFGAVVAHLQNEHTHDFQPANVTWAPFPPLETNVRDKKQRRRLMAERALASIDAFVRESSRETVSAPAS